MAVFEYSGLKSNGRKVNGVIDSDSVRNARRNLREKGIYPTALFEVYGQSNNLKKGLTAISFSRSVGVGTLSIATRQLSTLVGAGMPLVNCMDSLKQQIDHQELKRCFSEVRDQINEGSTFAEALRKFPKVFPSLYVNMVASGEASGSLDLVLERLSELLEGQAILKRRLQSASIYPVLMIFLCFGVVVILLNYVVPEITAIFKDQQKTLPFATRIIIGLSEFSQHYWWIVLVLIGVALFSYRRFAATEGGREQVDRIKLKMPVLGNMSKKVATGRISRTMSTLLSSGVDMLTALSIVKNMVSNVVIGNAITEISIGVKEGRSFAGELQKTQLFPPLLVNLVRIGEQTGSLEEMLDRVANAYDSEIDAFVSGITKIIEPLLILFIAVIVGGIMAAVMLPMVEMSQVAL